MEIGENKILETNDFDIAKSKQYHLSLRIGIDNFSFSILDTVTLSYNYLVVNYFTYISIKDTVEKITSIIKNNNLFQLNFSSSSLIYSGFPNTLLPKELEDSTNEKKLLEFNDDKCYEKIYSDNIDNIKIIYSIPETVDNITKTFFPTCKIMSEEKIFLEKKIYADLSTCVYINFNLNSFSLTIFENKELKLQNSFNYKGAEDVLYYVLFCMEQLNLSAIKTPVVLFGNIDYNDKIYELMFNYIKDISFGDIDKNLRLNLKKDRHKYFSLLSQILCV